MQSIRLLCDRLIYQSHSSFHTQGTYDLPPNSSSTLQALAKRNAADAAHPAEFSLGKYLSAHNLGYESITNLQQSATFALMIGGGRTVAKVNASIDDFVAAFEKSMHETNLFPQRAYLHVCKSFSQPDTLSLHTDITRHTYAA